MCKLVLLLLLAAGLGPACRDQAQPLRVEVRSELRVPDQLDEVTVEIRGTLVRSVRYPLATHASEGRFTMPLSMTVPTGEAKAGEIEISAWGSHQQTPVTVKVTARLVLGAREARVLELFLSPISQGDAAASMTVDGGALAMDGAAMAMDTAAVTEDDAPVAFDAAAAIDAGTMPVDVGAAVVDVGTARDVSTGVDAGINRALGARVTADSRASGYSEMRVNDGDRNTTVGPQYGWANDHSAPGGVGQLPQAVTFDFLTPQLLSRVEIYTAEGYPIRAYLVQYRTNQDSSWQTLVTVTGNVALHLVHDFPPVSGSSLRILAQLGPEVQPAWARLNEVEIY